MDSGFWASAIVLFGFLFIVVVNVYKDWKIHSAINENPVCVIERIQKEVIGADGKVDAVDIMRECG